MEFPYYRWTWWHSFRIWTVARVSMYSVWPLLGPQFVGGRDTLRFPWKFHWMLRSGPENRGVLLESPSWFVWGETMRKTWTLKWYNTPQKVSLFWFHHDHDKWGSIGVCLAKSSNNKKNSLMIGCDEAWLYQTKATKNDHFQTGDIDAMGFSGNVIPNPSTLWLWRALPTPGVPCQSSRKPQINTKYVSHWIHDEHIQQHSNVLNF